MILYHKNTKTAIALYRICGFCLAEKNTEYREWYSFFLGAEGSFLFEPYSLRASNAQRLALRALLRQCRNARGAIGAIRTDERAPRCESA